MAPARAGRRQLVVFDVIAEVAADNAWKRFASHRWRDGCIARDVIPAAGALADDRAFDEQLPPRLQVQAAAHFTPVEVARRAARLLASSRGMTVLDVGAGAGKFCLAAALAVPDCEFVGIEWRPHLVDLANALARNLGVHNARFLSGDALDLDWSPFDAFYLYNPFAEQLIEDTFVLDRSIERGPDTFVTCVTGVRRKLARARTGTRLAMFHGYGAPPPPGYELSAKPPVGCVHLELWIKTSSTTRELDIERQETE